mmetsp:Transcript_12814/g.31405  ORF Transcript_12814/g.31405 Transcript_12814/m.31405 type:complete len:224 (-) Transcript_12814:990-1661(-)
MQSPAWPGTPADPLAPRASGCAGARCAAWTGAPALVQCRTRGREQGEEACGGRGRAWPQGSWPGTGWPGGHCCHGPAPPHSAAWPSGHPPPQGCAPCPGQASSHACGAQQPWPRAPGGAAAARGPQGPRGGAGRWGRVGAAGGAARRRCTGGESQPRQTQWGRQRWGRMQGRRWGWGQPGTPGGRAPQQRWRRQRPWRCRRHCWRQRKPGRARWRTRHSCCWR